MRKYHRYGVAAAMLVACGGKETEEVCAGACGAGTICDAASERCTAIGGAPTRVEITINDRRPDPSVPCNFCGAGTVCNAAAQKCVAAPKPAEPVCERDEYRYEVRPVLDGQRGPPGAQLVIAMVVVDAFSDIDMRLERVDVERPLGSPKIRLTVDGVLPGSGGTAPQDTERLMFWQNQHLAARARVVLNLEGLIDVNAMPGQKVPLLVSAHAVRISDGKAACNQQKRVEITVEVTPPATPPTPKPTDTPFPPGHPCAELEASGNLRRAILLPEGTRVPIEHAAGTPNARLVGWKLYACLPTRIDRFRASVDAMGSSDGMSVWAGLIGANSVWNISRFVLDLESGQVNQTLRVVSPDPGTSSDTLAKADFRGRGILEIGRGTVVTLALRSDTVGLPARFVNEYAVYVDFYEVSDPQTGTGGIAVIQDQAQIVRIVGR